MMDEMLKIIENRKKIPSMELMRELKAEDNIKLFKLSLEVVMRYNHVHVYTLNGIEYVGVADPEITMVIDNLENDKIIQDKYARITRELRRLKNGKVSNNAE
jgi:hypothetical protein